jgi:GNAT superfamily N-acetyltransferase
LEALGEAPEAFSATLGEARLRPDKQWMQEAATHSTGQRSATYLVFASGQPVSLAGAYFDDEIDGLVHLVAVWIRPEHRGTGAAASLVRTVADWAARSGGMQITAWVTQGNVRAERFYNKIGFATMEQTRSYIPPM